MNTKQSLDDADTSTVNTAITESEKLQPTIFVQNIDMVVLLIAIAQIFY